MGCAVVGAGRVLLGVALCPALGTRVCPPFWRRAMRAAAPSRALGALGAAGRPPPACSRRGASRLARRAASTARARWVESSDMLVCRVDGEPWTAAVAKGTSNIQTVTTGGKPGSERTGIGPWIYNGLCRGGGSCLDGQTVGSLHRRVRTPSQSSAAITMRARLINLALKSRNYSDARARAYMHVRLLSLRLGSMGCGSTLGHAHWFRRP